MNEWKKARIEDEQAPVPEELNDRVRAGIAEGRRKIARRRLWVRSLGCTAACFAVLLAELNLSPVFAAAAAELPVVGPLCRVLTVRSYHEKDGDVNYEIDQPAVSGDSNFAEQINREIQKRVDDKSAEGAQIVADYKEAFLATGGTEAEWETRDNTVSVTYEIKSQTETTVSFVVDTYVSVASAYQEKYFYNLDVANNQELTLNDLLGSDWVEICNESIQKQIADSDDPSVYFKDFATVDDTTGFYINADGNPVVVFPRGAAAMGAMGSVEFEISGSTTQKK